MFERKEYLIMKRLIAIALSALAIFALVGCSSGSSSSSTPKDYAQIIHDARSDEENEYQMIARPGEEEGQFTAIDGSSADFTAEDLSSNIANFTMPLLGLEEGDYEDFAASVSGIITQSYGIAIVKPAEGRTDAVKEALENFVTTQQKSMENYLMDQYEIAKAAKVEVVPSGEVVLVCCENSDAVLASIKAALAV